MRSSARSESGGIGQIPHSKVIKCIFASEAAYLTIFGPLSIVCQLPPSEATSVGGEKVAMGDIISSHDKFLLAGEGSPLLLTSNSTETWSFVAD